MAIRRPTSKQVTRATSSNIEDWGGFIGQWDDRQWSSSGNNENYGEMVGLKPGFIKRADLAWYSTHHHDAAGKNVAYSYSYLFGYGLNMPAGAKTLKLPDNRNIRILAISVANENPTTRPAQPLYDVLPSPNAGTPDFSLSAPPAASVSQGMSATSHVLIMPIGSFDDKVKLTVSGLPEGVSADFNPAVATEAASSTLDCREIGVTCFDCDLTITGSAGEHFAQHDDGSLGHSGSDGHCSGGSVVCSTTCRASTRMARNSSERPVSTPVVIRSPKRRSGREQVGDEVVFKLGPANATGRSQQQDG